MVSVRLKKSEDEEVVLSVGQRKGQWCGMIYLSKLQGAEATLEAPEIISVVNRMVSACWDGVSGARWGDTQ